MLISLIDYVTLVTSNTIEIILTVHITEEGVLSYGVFSHDVTAAMLVP